MTDGRLSPPPHGEALPPPRANTGIIIAVVVAVLVIGTLLIGVCAGLLLPALGAARNSARMTRSMTNLKQIGNALLAYANDNAGNAPEADANLPARLANYADPSVWSPPTSAPAAQVYFYVPVGNFNAVKNPSVQILMYEAPGLWRRGGGSILFCDGSVRHLDGLAYDQTIDKITLPDGTPWAPHRKTRK